MAVGVAESDVKQVRINQTHARNCFKLGLFFLQLQTLQKSLPQYTFGIH